MKDLTLRTDPMPFVFGDNLTQQTVKQPNYVKRAPDPKPKGYHPYKGDPNFTLYAVTGLARYNNAEEVLESVDLVAVLGKKSAGYIADEEIDLRPIGKKRVAAGGPIKKVAKRIIDFDYIRELARELYMLVDNREFLRQWLRKNFNVAKLSEIESHDWWLFEREVKAEMDRQLDMKAVADLAKNMKDIWSAADALAQPFGEKAISLYQK